MEHYELFDFKRIFLGERSLLFLVEIIFRTIIMYLYTIVLLRFLGKRSMGQISNLELAIIISFGSAVGDPMIGADIPILYGIVCITTVALMQTGMEKVINKSHRLEKIMEGEAVCLVKDGRIHINALYEEKLSPEDLFRKLRVNEVTQLGEVKKAYFETSGEMTIIWQDRLKVKKGLPILPEEVSTFHTTMPHAAGTYCCTLCGYARDMEKNEHFVPCRYCDNETWVLAKK